MHVLPGEFPRVFSNGKLSPSSLGTINLLCFQNVRSLTLNIMCPPENLIMEVHFSLRGFRWNNKNNKVSRKKRTKASKITSFGLLADPISCRHSFHRRHCLPEGACHNTFGITGQQITTISGCARSFHSQPAITINLMNARYIIQSGRVSPSSTIYWSSNCNTTNSLIKPLLRFTLPELPRAVNRRNWSAPVDWGALAQPIVDETGSCVEADGDLGRSNGSEMWKVRRSKDFRATKRCLLIASRVADVEPKCSWNCRWTAIRVTAGQDAAQQRSVCLVQDENWVVKSDLQLGWRGCAQYLRRDDRHCDNDCCTKRTIHTERRVTRRIARRTGHSNESRTPSERCRSLIGGIVGHCNYNYIYLTRYLIIISTIGSKAVYLFRLVRKA